MAFMQIETMNISFGFIHRSASYTTGGGTWLFQALPCISSTLFITLKTLASLPLMVFQQYFSSIEIVQQYFSSISVEFNCISVVFQ